MDPIDVGALRDTVVSLASLKREGNCWDFKRKRHTDRAKLLHDIICLANNLEQSTSYLIIGIDEDRGHIAVDVTDDDNRRDTQELTDLIAKVSWFGSL